MSDASAINLRARSDLVCKQSPGQSTPGWVLKDPWTLEFFQLGEEEYFLFRLLQGSCTRSAIREAFDRTFAPKRLKPDRLQSFLVQLHQAGLLIARAPGQGAVLRKRRKKRQSQDRWRRFGNPLAVRFGGMNPAELFEWLYGKIDWLFSLPAQLACGVLLLVGLANAVFLREPLLAEASRVDHWLQVKQMWLFMVAIGGVKIAHEFGHALTLRHWGGRCHELGIMLLAFCPCLYCNVSDAWLLESKWRRISVSFAGIWVELLIAALSVCVWSWTDVGMLHDLALVLSVICSVNALLINGNPLMRFDGYFVLSDWVERPNLAEQARVAMADTIQRWSFSRRQPKRSETSQPAWLACYAMGSLAYRVVIVTVVIWGLYQLLLPYGMEVMAWVVLFAIVGQILWSRSSWLRANATSISLRGPEEWFGGRGWRLLTVIVLTGMIAVWTFPDYVVLTGVVMPTDHQEVRVAKAGRLAHALDYGSYVSGGDEIARLVNPRVESELQKLKGELREQQQRVEVLRQKKLRGEIAEDLPKAEQVLLANQVAVDQKRQERADVVIRAPQSGYLIRPQLATAEFEDRPSRWRGDPLDDWNTGRFMDFGDVVCGVSRLEQFEALLLVDAPDLGDITRGASVDLRIGRHPRGLWEGTITDIAPLAWEDAHPSTSLLTGGMPAESRPGSLFMVRVRIAGHGAQHIVMGGAKVRLRLTDRSLWRRTIRWARRLWNAV